MGDDTLFCPDCGKYTLHLIEETEPDAGGEYKEIRNCPVCDNLVYIIRECQE